MTQKIPGWVLRHKLATAVPVLLALGWGAFELGIRSSWFLAALRQNAVAQLERVSGGTVALEDFRFGDSRLAFEIRGLQIRTGHEQGGAPLLAVPHAALTFGWRSLLGDVTVLESLRVQGPVVDLTRGQDVWTKLGQASGEALRSGFVVHRFALDGGQLVWNGQLYGLEFRGAGLRVATTFDPTSRQYMISAELREPQFGRDDSPALAGTTASLTALADHTGVEIRRAEIRGENLVARLRGTLRGRRQPSVRCVYSLQAETALLAGLFGQADPGLEGSLEVSGELEWDTATGGLLYSGGFTAASLGLPALRLDLAVAGRFLGSESGIELTELAGSALGGSVRAQAAIEAPWAAPRVAASGSGSGIALEGLALALGSGAPVWGGLVETDFEVSGTLPRDLLARLDLRIQPTARPSKLPLDGTATLLASAARQSIVMESFSIRTPNLLATGDGHISAARGGSLQVALEVSSKPGLERILAALNTRSPLLSLAPDGRYAYRGSLDWEPDHLARAKLSGDFTIADFAWRGQHWDQLALRGTLTPDRLEIAAGHLSDSAGELRLNGSLPLLPDGPLDLAVSATAIDAGKLARASGFTLPIEGRLAMQVELTGSQARPMATSSITVADPMFLGESFEQLQAELDYTAAGFELRKASLRRGTSRLGVTASLSRQTGEVQLGIESNRWRLEEFSWARALAPELSGALRFDLRAAGPASLASSLEALELAGAWDVSELNRGGLELGNWSGTIGSERNAESIQIDWAAEVFDGTFRGTATVWRQLSPPSYNGKIEFDNLNARRLAELLDLPGGTPRGTLAGQAGFGGVLGSTGTFEMNGTIERAELSLPSADSGPLLISNVFPLRWGIRDGALRFDSMVLTGPDTDFRIDGAVGLTGERSLDVSIDGGFNLRLLEGLAAGIATSGTSKVGMRLRGSLADPVFAGSLELVDAAVDVPGGPVQLGNLNGAIEFQGRQGKIRRLTATAGGGTVQFSGVTTYRASEFEYRIQAVAKDVRVHHPPNIASVIDADLTWAGVGGSSILNGNVLISRLSTANDLSFAELFASLEAPARPLAASPLLEGLQVNVHVAASRQLPIKTTLVRNVEADLDLDIVGTLANPAVIGEIQIAQGELRMLGTHYRVDRGDIRFIDAPRAEPILNVELETRIRDVDLTLVLSGPARNLDLSYRSDPPLPFHDLVDLVAVGKEPTVDPSIASRRRLEQQSVVQTGADNILSQAVSRPVSRRLQRFFGVSRLKVDPQVGGLESNPSARLSTEQQLADDLTLIYSYDLSSSQQQAIRLEWNPDRKWSFIVTRDQNGLLGSDVLYKLRVR